MHMVLRWTARLTSFIVGGCAHVILQGQMQRRLCSGRRSKSSLSLSACYFTAMSQPMSLSSSSPRPRCCSGQETAATDGLSPLTARLGSPSMATQCALSQPSTREARAFPSRSRSWLASVRRTLKLSSGRSRRDFLTVGGHPFSSVMIVRLSTMESGVSRHVNVCAGNIVVFHVVIYELFAAPLFQPTC